MGKIIDLTADPQIRIPQAPLRLRDEVVEVPTSSVNYLNTLLTGFNDGISVEKLGYGVQRLEISGAIPKPITVKISSSTKYKKVGADDTEYDIANDSTMMGDIDASYTTVSQYTILYRAQAYINQGQEIGAIVRIVDSSGKQLAIFEGPTFYGQRTVNMGEDHLYWLASTGQNLIDAQTRTGSLWEWGGTMATFGTAKFAGGKASITVSDTGATITATKGIKRCCLLLIGTLSTFRA